MVVAFWPQIKAAASAVVDGFGSFRGGETDAVAKATASVSYQQAIAYLAEVRTRLKVTEKLDDARKVAIDTLTLALVEGSDQP